MRILGISNSWPGPRRPWGNVFFRECLKGLVGRDHVVDVLAPRAWVRDPPAKNVGGILNLHQPRFLSLSNVSLPGRRNTLRWGQWFNARACRKYAKVHLNRPDIIYGKFMSTCSAARSLNRVFGSPWIVSVGESIWDWEQHLIPQFGRRQLKEHLTAAYGIETVSNELKCYIQTEFNIPEHKVEFVPNGVSPEVFCPGNQVKARQQLGLDSAAFYVAFIGRANVNKGPERVLQAIEQLPAGRQTEAILIGVPSSWGHRCGVAFAGAVPIQSVPLYLQAADIFVLPTTNEGMCNAILEALSVGLPVVTSDLPFNHEILSRDEGILIDPLNVKAIRDAIMQLRGDRELRRQLGLISRYVANKFTLIRRVAKVELFLSKVLGKNGLAQNLCSQETK